ncbi:MAG: LysE family transporter [candidate division WOR-3 bacterium]
MDIVILLFQTIFISLSGVMAPGPLTAVTIGEGSKNSNAGALISFGHGIVEFPLIFFIFFGFKSFIETSLFREVVGIIGGMFLFWMGWDMVRSIKNMRVEGIQRKRKPVISGILLSLGNPYFIIWWATVGATLIMRFSNFGFIWFIVFVILHWLCDFLWLYFISFISYRGGSFFGKKFQKGVFLFCGIALFFLGGRFIFDALIKI